VILWRLSNHADLSGRGGMRAAGRWHSIGRPIVYLSEDAASCLVEAHAHDLGPGAIPAGYRWLEIEVAGETEVGEIEELPARWADELAATRGLGDRWLERRSSALLRVPSVWSPATRNILFNPRHPDAARVSIRRVLTHPLDVRAGTLRSPSQPSKRRSNATAR